MMSKNRENWEILQQLIQQGVTDKLEIDEAMLRYYVYGSIDKVESCDIVKRVLTNNTYKTKFPTCFISMLIQHMTKCDTCVRYYLTQATKDA